MTFLETKIARIADLLVDHRLRREPLDTLPSHLLPIDPAIIDRVMLGMVERLPWAPGGWKVGAAS